MLFDRTLHGTKRGSLTAKYLTPVSSFPLHKPGGSPEQTSVWNDLTVNSGRSHAMTLVRLDLESFCILYKHLEGEYYEQ